MNFLKSYLSHLAGYIVSAATIVSTLSPNVFPPKYAFITAVATAVATAFSHGQTLQANGSAIITAVAKATTDAVNAAAGSAKVLMVLAALPLLATLHGCASVQSFFSSPTGQEVVIAGVDVAVTTAESKGVSALQINSVAKSVLAADSGASATLAALSSAVDGAAVKAGVPSGDMLAFQILEAAFDSYLLTKYGNNPAVANVQADVAAFCHQVIIDTGG
jgi:uncharacterized protein YceK